MILNNQNKTLAEKGFTIIEVVIVTAIFAILTLALLNVFDWHNKSFLLERAETNATGSARIAMNNMGKYIAQASQIQTSRTISGTTYTTDADTLVLQLPAVDNGGNLLAGINDYVVYYKTGTSLYQLTELGSGSSRSAGTRLMSSFVNTIAFTYDNADVTLATKVVVDLQTQAASRGTNTSDTHVTNTIFLRNR